MKLKLNLKRIPNFDHSQCRPFNETITINLELYQNSISPKFTKSVKLEMHSKFLPKVDCAKLGHFSDNRNRFNGVPSNNKTFSFFTKNCRLGD